VYIVLNALVKEVMIKVVHVWGCFIAEAKWRLKTSRTSVSTSSDLYCRSFVLRSYCQIKL